MALDDSWMKKAACAQLDEPTIDRLFFPIKRKGVKTDYSGAKKICETCPVRIHCLTYSIAHGISDGVWGGLSPLERKRLDRETKVMYRKAWWRVHPLSRPYRTERR